MGDYLASMSLQEYLHTTAETENKEGQLLRDVSSCFGGGVALLVWGMLGVI